MSDVLLKMRRAGAHAWLYVTAYFVLSIAQATLSTSQVQSPQLQSPYLLGLGELFLVDSIQGL
jgi:hypothetical protein